MLEALEPITKLNNDVQLYGLDSKQKQKSLSVRRQYKNASKGIDGLLSDWEQMAMVAASGCRDYEYLMDSTPLMVAKMYIKEQI